MAKIPYSELIERIRNPEVPDRELRKYFTVRNGQGGFDFEVSVNPAKVELTAAEQELENAMQIGNGIARLRRRLAFFDRVAKYPDRPVLVSEGDSWFQFPLLIDETIDHLSREYNIWSLCAAGDTLANMVDGASGQGGFEFLAGLRRHRDTVKAFLFSGAGNDIIGEDPQTRLPMLSGLLQPFNGNVSDIDAHVDFARLEDRIRRLEEGYRRIIALVRAEPGLESLPIIFHGYDYPFPYPFNSADKRNPVYAAKDQWLGRAFAARNIFDVKLRRGVIERLIDSLYDMLDALANDPGMANVWVVNCRGALPALSDWHDEIHGTSKGFKKVGERFQKTIQKAIAQSGALGART